MDSSGKIIIISEEEILNYSRPLISYYLGNRVPLEKMPFKDRNFYQENGTEVLLGVKAKAIDIRKQEVRCEDDKKIKFAKLLLATGGEAIVPPLEGREVVKEGIFTFTSLADTQRLIKYIEEEKIKEAVVLGAGLIGLKSTEGLAERGLKVTIVELADRVLANTFDTEASGILEEALKGWGCTVFKEDTVVKVAGREGRLERIFLKSGKELPAWLLILAIGVRPNLGLIKNTSIKCDRGILVNECMQTTVRDIYAAGDVAQGKDFLSQKDAVIAVWPVAARQGKIAGFNMAGRPTKYEGLFAMNAVELAGMPTISFGIANPPPEEGYEILSRNNGAAYRKIVLRDNRIVGAIFLGKIERAGIICGLIKDKVDVSGFKKDLLRDDFGLLILPAEYRKHLVRGEGILI